MTALRDELCSHSSPLTIARGKHVLTNNEVDETFATD